MIWDSTKKVQFEISGELLNAEFRIPTCIDMEDFMSQKKVTDSYVVKKCLISIDGFKDADELISTPGAYLIVRALGGAILETCNLDVTLKN